MIIIKGVTSDQRAGDRRRETKPGAISPGEGRSIFIGERQAGRLVCPGSRGAGSALSARPSRQPPARGCRTSHGDPRTTGLLCSASAISIPAEEAGARDSLGKRHVNTHTLIFILWGNKKL